MTSSDDPDGALSSELRTLREANRVLLAENDSLAERAEETLLLGMIAEKVGQCGDESEILESGLEQIAFLKDIGLCSYWSVEDETIVLRTLFRTYTTEVQPTLCLEPDSEAGKQLLAGMSLIPLTRGEHLWPVLKTLGMNPHEILIIPGKESSGFCGVYCFAHPDSEDRLLPLHRLLVRAVDIISNRVVILRLLNSLRALNADLDVRIADRTRELTEANVALALALEEQKRIQDRLVQSQKMEAIGQLAGGVAHDFNNMLAGIVAGAELLKHRLREKNPEHMKYISMILDASDRAAGLTKMLLSFARRQPVGSTPVDIHRIVHAAVALLKSTIDRSVQIEMELGAEGTTVLGDFSQLQSVFLNLGINASHAMPNGGVLRFSTTGFEATDPNWQSAAFEMCPGPCIAIDVRDSGEGIAPEHLSRIFEPFFSTKRQGKGTGLGLSASLGIIAQHRGTIQVNSELGKGSLFRVLLPLTSQPIIEAPADTTALPLHTGVILLVDDEPMIRAAGSALLENFGYKVLIAENGQEALAIYKEHRDEIDLVMLDMVMPKMNGRDCFYALRAIRPDVKVIVSSGFSRGEDLQDLQENGLSGFIQKPFRAADLSRMLEKTLKNTAAIDR